jgi:signal transduction histidine kinase
VDQILAFARTTEPTFAPVSLNEVIDELGLLVRHKLRNQGIQFVRRLEPNLSPVKADATQLEQAFLNLILNASEAMPSGGTLTVTSRKATAKESPKGPHIAVEFKDTGEGMTETQRRRAFSSVLATTKAKGTGLGLAIVARIIETHHGAIKIKSRPGAGTTITVLLPV